MMNYFGNYYQKKIFYKADGGLMELLPIYGTYKSGQRFFKNPTFGGALDFGASLAGDALTLTGIGAGAGAAIKSFQAARKAKNLVKTGTKLVKGRAPENLLNAAKNIANHQAGKGTDYFTKLGKKLNTEKFVPSLEEAGPIYDDIAAQYRNYINYASDAKSLGTMGAASGIGTAAIKAGRQAYEDK